jgi:prepilin-type N-terminal cleavage/methylation domain-containing protein
MSRAQAEHGFTLIELLVTMAIATIIFGATLSVLDVFQKHNVIDQQRNEVQDNARNTMDRLARQLRNVAAPSTGSPGALLVTNPYFITFDTIDSTSSFAWEANKSHTMMLRYCLNDENPENEILWVQSKRWKTAEGPKEAPTSTACPDLGGSWESNSQVVQHVTNRIGGENRPMFVYSAATAPQTASVEIDMFLDLRPGHRPGETQLTSGIGLRNANRPPIAVFTVTQINEFVRLDASASNDPDGLALTYKWFKDGAAMASTSQVVEAKETKGAHTYELEVTDPGGLAEKSKETVTIK